MAQAGLSVRQLALVMAGAGLVVCVCWSAYTLLCMHSSPQQGPSETNYQAVGSEAIVAVLQGTKEWQLCCAQCGAQGTQAQDTEACGAVPLTVVAEPAVIRAGASAVRRCMR